jgi:glucuronokinase
MEYYEVSDKLPKVELPSLILSVEADLGITAGLQDRVIQVPGCFLFNLIGLLQTIC